MYKRKRSIRCWKSDGTAGGWMARLSRWSRIRIWSVRKNAKSADLSQDFCLWSQILGPSGSLSLWLVPSTIILRSTIQCLYIRKFETDPFDLLFSLAVSMNDGVKRSVFEWINLYLSPCYIFLRTRISLLAAFIYYPHLFFSPYFTK